ncbi:hypothetical protein BE221DRAFT_202257 [Ostreococcus tauri]|uniref:Uncharacterized protein n=1 Tax=Ostreococcus tauri TaxID=70448 RepID=A0A1Y5I0P6_OSTTA|nr:hypothetical protein BE221DRAFT_202257 [Ostreococcus tauri]
MMYARCTDVIFPTACGLLGSTGRANACTPRRNTSFKRFSHELTLAVFVPSPKTCASGRTFPSPARTGTTSPHTKHKCFVAPSFVHERTVPQSNADVLSVASA